MCTPKLDIQLDSGVSVLQRRITELEQALDRCQKRLEIPTVNLTAHPDVDAAASKVGEGGKVDLDALGLGRRVKDDAFLNQVQVRWYQPTTVLRKGRQDGRCAYLASFHVRQRMQSSYSYSRGLE